MKEKKQKRVVGKKYKALIVFAKLYVKYNGNASKAFEALHSKHPELSTTRETMFILDVFFE